MFNHQYFSVKNFDRVFSPQAMGSYTPRTRKSSIILIYSRAMKNRDIPKS